MIFTIFDNMADAMEWTVFLIAPLMFIVGPYITSVNKFIPFGDHPTNRINNAAFVSLDMDAYNGIDSRIIDMAVIFIIINVIMVVCVMMGYAINFLHGNVDNADIDKLVYDMVIDFSILFLIYPIVNGSKKAYVLAVVLICINLLIYISATFRDVPHTFIIILSVAALIVLLMNPIRGWCLDKKDDVPVQ